jgi:hypothetical protein
MTAPSQPPEKEATAALLCRRVGCQDPVRYRGFCSPLCYAVTEALYAGRAAGLAAALGIARAVVDETERSVGGATPMAVLLVSDAVHRIVHQLQALRLQWDEEAPR